MTPDCTDCAFSMEIAFFQKPYTLSNEFKLDEHMIKKGSSAMFGITFGLCFFLVCRLSLSCLHLLSHFTPVSVSAKITCITETLVQPLNLSWHLFLYGLSFEFEFVFCFFCDRF